MKQLSLIISNSLTDIYYLLRETLCPRMEKSWTTISVKNPFEGTLMPSHSDAEVFIYSSSMFKVFQSTMIALKSNCSRIKSGKNRFWLGCRPLLTLHSYRSNTAHIRVPVCGLCMNKVWAMCEQAIRSHNIQHLH